MTKIIGIPNQELFNRRQRDAAEKAQMMQAERQYHIGLRLELCQKYGLENATKYYDEIKDYPYPEISFYAKALMVSVDGNNKDSMENVYKFLKGE